MAGEATPFASSGTCHPFAPFRSRRRVARRNRTGMRSSRIRARILHRPGDDRCIHSEERNNLLGEPGAFRMRSAAALGLQKRRGIGLSRCLAEPRSLTSERSDALLEGIAAHDISAGLAAQRAPDTIGAGSADDFRSGQVAGVDGLADEANRSIRHRRVYAARVQTVGREKALSPLARLARAANGIGRQNGSETADPRLTVAPQKPRL